MKASEGGQGGGTESVCAGQGKKKVCFVSDATP